MADVVNETDMEVDCYVQDGGVLETGLDNDVTSYLLEPNSEMSIPVANSQVAFSSTEVSTRARVLEVQNDDRVRVFLTAEQMLVAQKA